MADGQREGDFNFGSFKSSKKCPECPPPGLPAWMATFSDLVTLLLTFFVLLLSFAKTESAKYEAALGSIRQAFGGNVLLQGEVIEKGKSPEDSPTMLESQDPVRPFPIEFLTTQGILDKHEINRASDEDLELLKEDLNQFNLSESVDIYEMSEGIRVQLRDKIYFKESLVTPSQMEVDIYGRLVKMLSKKSWTLSVMGQASVGEESLDGRQDAFALSAARAAAVTRSLIKRGVPPERVITTFYGDSKARAFKEKYGKENAFLYRCVEFMIRKRDPSRGGHKIDSP